MKFKGWNELKEAYLKEEKYLETHFLDVDANFPFTNDDTIMSIASKLATLKKEAIDDTLSLVTHDDLQKAVQIIRKASSIYVFAVSNNGLISQEFAHNMSRIQKKVTICHLQGELVLSLIHIYTNIHQNDISCCLFKNMNHFKPIRCNIYHLDIFMCP